MSETIQQALDTTFQLFAVCGVGACAFAMALMFFLKTGRRA